MQANGNMGPYSSSRRTLSILQEGSEEGGDKAAARPAAGGRGGRGSPSKPQAGRRMLTPAVFMHRWASMVSGSRCCLALVCSVCSSPTGPTNAASPCCF